MNHAKLYHFIGLTVTIISIYFLRYTHVYNLRQKECSQSSIHDVVWITRSDTLLGKYRVVETGKYRLYFSQTHAPVIGERIELIGTVDERSQCATSSQLGLIVRSYRVIQINTLSPLSLLRNPFASLEVITNKYLRSTEEEMYRYLPSEHVHILLGMTIGKKYSSQEDIAVAVKSAGLTHVLVASGANIALLIQFSRASMRQIYSRKKVLMVSLIVAFIYVVVVGNQAPILRAFLMFSYVTVASLLGRKMPWHYPLYFGGSILLIYQPLLVFSLSFWLTMAATTAVLVDSRGDESELVGSLARMHSEFTQTFRSTVLVFLFTLPLLLYTIGQTTLLTLMSSALLLWIVGPITILGLLTILVLWAMPAMVHGIFFLALWVPLEIFIRFVHLISALTFLTLSLTQPSILGCALYYVVLVTWSFVTIAKRSGER